MKVKKLINIALILIVIFSWGCHLVFEEDIDNKNMVIFIPSDNYISTESNLSFWWEEIEGADYYQINVYKINNGHVSGLLTDTNLSSNQFEWSFSPGDYEWSIQAFNSAYTSNTTIRKFSIDSSLNINSSKVIQIIPYANSFINNKVVFLKWLTVYNAEKYFIQVKDQNNIYIGTQLMADTNFIQIPNESLLDTLNEGTYEWTIHAENSYSVSLKSSQIFHIDRTNPGNINILTPSNNAILLDSLIHFSWVSGSDNHWSFDSLFIYDDTLALNLVYKNEVLYQNYKDSIGPGEYFWQIKSFDKAGNFSFSQFSKFQVQ